MNKVINICKKLLTRNVIAGIGTAAALAGMLLVFSYYYTCCFEFFVNGRSIGFSQSSEFYEQTKADVNREISESFGDSACITAKAAVVPRIIKKTDMTSYQQFFDNIALMSDYMVNAHTLVINGSETVSFLTKRDLDTAMNSLLDEYSGGGEVELREEINETAGYVSAMKAYSAEDGEQYIKNNELIHADAVVSKTYTEPIAYEEQTVENSDMYEGETAVLQEGENGQKTVNAKITLLNGIETAREIISETVTKQPVAQICSVGTKLVPNGIGSGTFIFPTTGTISSRYGSRWGRTHEGVDIANSLGTDIYAADEGKVIFSGVQNGYGNIIIIDHGNGYTTRYGHCSELLKNVGDIVAKGDVIAKSGNTGRSTGNHVHFEIRKDGEALDPLDFVG